MMAAPSILLDHPGLEVACFTASSVAAAAAAGADRIEVCADRFSGGTTPSIESLREILNNELSTPLSVMIRPRGGDFVYSDAEFEQMKADIREIKSLDHLVKGLGLGFEVVEGENEVDVKRNSELLATARPNPVDSVAEPELMNADIREIECLHRAGEGLGLGFVFGVLEEKGRVDVKRNSELVAIAGPNRCTFHRAFDETRDADEALDDVVECGFATVLTSGRAEDAVRGVEVLKRLVERGKGRIVVMPGGGVRSSNVRDLRERTGATLFHSSAILDEGDEVDVTEVRLLKESLQLV